MSNRFHSKFHRQNHHTYPNSYNPDASHDPIASRQQPFQGDFVLQGALSCYAPLSATAGYFYSNYTALCAIGLNKGLHVNNSGSTNSTGIYVYSTGIALSAYSTNYGINVYAPNYGVSVFGGLSGIISYSPNYGITSYGGIYAGRFSSLIRGLSSYGGAYGLDATSPNYGINSYGGAFAVNAYSPQRGLSAYGGLVGADIYSPQTGINVKGLGAAIIAFSPTVALSSGGGGVNRFDNRVGIFKTPASNMSLDVKGNSYIDGDLTVTGDISAYGVFSYFDTKVSITSSLKVTNIGTDAAVTISQQGAYPVLVCYDADQSTVIPSFIVDGASMGWVALGIATPTAPFHIVKDYFQTNNQPHIRITDGLGSPKTLVMGTSTTNIISPFIGTETNHDLRFVTNNITRMLITNTGDLSSSGNLTLGGNLSASGLTITGDMSGSGNLTLGGNLSASGLTISGNISASGNVTGSNLAISNWDGVYSKVNSNSANWDAAYKYITNTPILTSFYVSPVNLLTTPAANVNVFTVPAGKRFVGKEIIGVITAATTTGATASPSLKIVNASQGNTGILNTWSPTALAVNSAHSTSNSNNIIANTAEQVAVRVTTPATGFSTLSADIIIQGYFI